MSGINPYLTKLEAEIKSLKFGQEPPSLYQPIHYIMSLGGKRLRPLLMLLSYSLYKNDFNKVIRMAAALEAFHNFTLMHDDIMDNAPLRRGKTTVHKKWDQNTAILSGDVMLVKVYGLLTEVEENKLKGVLQLFNECAAGVCEGQQMDMAFESLKKVSEVQYLEMIRLKTAILLGFSLELGALLADASVEDQKALRRAGTHLGLAFQLKDDLLDVFADKKKFGKRIGGDIIANKKTFLLIKALEKSTGKEKKELQRWINAKKFAPAKKVKAVTTLYDSLGIKGLTEEKINAYIIQAYRELDRLSAGNKSELIKFIGQLAGRQQ